MITINQDNVSELKRPDSFIDDPIAGILSSSTVGRLKPIWQHEYDQWLKRDLFQKCYAHVW